MLPQPSPPRTLSSVAAPTSAEHAPQPLRVGDGAILIGPSLRSRFLPAATIGLPLVSLLLGTFPATGLQQWRASRVRAGHDGLLEQLLAPWPVQLLLGAMLLWALLAAWMLVPLVLTRRTVLLHEARAGRAAELELRRGLRSAGRAPVSDVLYAVGEPERDGMALIGLRRAGAETGEGDEARAGDEVGEELEPLVWTVPFIGWDDASFDGLRVLHEAAGLQVAPPRNVLRAQARSARLRRLDREYARRLGMPWRPEYDSDRAAFQREFDRVRRVLGGREPARPGDPAPDPDRDSGR